MDTLFYILGEDIWWGPYTTFVQAQQKIKKWNDYIHSYIENGTYPKEYHTTTEFEIIEVPITRRTKVKYNREIKESRVETLD